MTLYKKIKHFYPELTDDDFHPDFGTIRLQNNSDGQGDYIAIWNHPTLVRLTDEQIKGAE